MPPSGSAYSGVTDSSVRGPRGGIASLGNGDAAAVATLLGLASAVTWLLARDVASYVRGDWQALFLPWYTFQGRQLRAGGIPGWNPHQFAGAPFAGDPQSGWGYLPAMAGYALLPPAQATTVFIGFHIALAAIAAYALGRLSGLRAGGALVAGTAYALPWLAAAAAAVDPFVLIHAWLPLALIGVELALQAGPPSRRFGGVVLGGLAVSQILAASPGQGAAYALLLIGGWTAWRAVVTPPRSWAPRQRLVAFAGVAAGAIGAGLLLNAGALLIRLQANALSTVPGGVYTRASRWTGGEPGLSLGEIATAVGGGFSSANWRYIGAAVVALALLAPLLAPRWPPLLFWLLSAAVAIVLAMPPTTPLHAAAFALLPRFATLHLHLPDRILFLLPLSAAMLAGATCDALVRQPVAASRRWFLLPVAALALVFVSFWRDGGMARSAIAAALAALALCAVALVARGPWARAVLPVALAAIVVWDPTGQAIAAGWGAKAGPERSLRAALGGDVAGFLHDNGAARFIAGGAGDAPARYAGYDPALLPERETAAGDLPPLGYRNHWLGEANWLLVLNWATWFGIDDVQGLNPAQPLRYAEFVEAINGHRQEYHELDLFPSGLDSPLLDLLNLRYLVVPADAAARDYLAPLVASLATVYRDEHVLVLERPTALPRVWLVHAARQVAPGGALAQLLAGDIDPRQTALLETTPPALTEPSEHRRESASYAAYEPDRVVAEVVANAPALLMVSEVWDPGWTATVDGARAPVYLADHVLRAVPVPEGRHTVELRYDPPALRIGIAISLATAMALVATWALLTFRHRRTPQRLRPQTDSG